MSLEEVYSIVFVLDKSGSMNVMGTEPVESMNNFIKVQKENNLKFKFTLVLFSDNVYFIYKNLDSDEIPEMKVDDYRAGGMTALYDAIGKAIVYQEDQKNDKVIFVILTDGQENASQEYRDNKIIKKMISDKENINKWKFTFLGANQDSFAVGSGLGIRRDGCSNFEYNPCGLNSVMKTLSAQISSTISQDYEKIE